jgi:predicted acylesterase/phospholipase RssA
MSIPPTKGLVETPQSKGHRIYVDGLVVGETPTPVLVNCGQHVVQVGTAGKEQSIDVPCGGAVTVAP